MASFLRRDSPFVLEPHGYDREGVELPAGLYERFDVLLRYRDPLPLGPLWKYLYMLLLFPASTYFEPLTLITA